MMASEVYLREGRFHQKYGDLEFDYITIDGIGFPPFPPVLVEGGFIQRIKDILNIDSRPDDVLLATYQKCGTHWTNEILNMLLQGNASYKEESKMNYMLEALHDLKIIDRAKFPRVLNTHIPYKWFPRKHIENGYKIVHTTRNPKDAYTSWYHHQKLALEMGPNTKHMTWDQYFEHAVMGKKAVYGSWFDYEKELSLAKEENKNIYTLHFENLKKDPETEIKGLAKFLGVDASEELVRDIADKCMFQNLKKADSEMKRTNPDMMKAFAEVQKIAPGRDKPVMFRKGIVGDWKNHFTVAQNEQFDALCDKELKDTKVKIIS
ncbi:hypothetical protein FSP39_013229 [Pinctada imbricata]|uniref:Sulfotransferase domain-containing protein n=1 Tax=Pinctada imbricata TaxID=66713 RepID=A0AA88YP50_PINIB|nr:hypothetical protein FSP39_013229 [Pinctada imbricata]